MDTYAGVVQCVCAKESVSVQHVHDISQGRHPIELSVRALEWKVHRGLVRERDAEREGECDMFSE